MAFVPVPKDLNRVKTKVMFNLTKRQLICFSIAAAVGVPIFFLAKTHLDLSTAAMLMVVIMLPFIFFALYEKDGQPAEKYLYHIVQSMFIRDKVRPYRTNNLYAEIQQKIKEQEELQLEQQHSKGKAYAETQITLSCEGYAFKAKGKTAVQNGWKAIEELFKASLKTKEKDDPMKSLPEVHEGDVLDSVSASVTEHFTTPPKQYTEDTLLSAMETAGNDQFDDDTEKKGLGTPATRAGIIEKLVRSGFAERKGKSLIPTKDGCNLVCVLPEQITSPAMTAEWENTLMEIERGNADADAFLSGIVQMTGDLVKAYPFLSDAEAQRFGTGKEEIGKCPRCGSPVYVGKGNFYCSNKECSFCLWEDNKFFSSKKKKLTKKIAKELLDKGWCRVTGLYTPKKPQLYDAVIRLDDSGGKYVSFKMEFDR